ncbi:type IV secretion system protein [Caballeronia sordidicola]|nr:type IV secretion system protein [Caballeronia sordidicola]
MATFNATTQIFSYIDTVVSQFVAANLGRIITAVTPVVALGLTISLMLEGLFLLARPGHEPLTGLVERFVKYALVISIASAGGWYQTSLANVAMKTPDEFASLFIINGASGSDQQNQIASVIDKAIDDGLHVAKTAFENAGVMSGPGIASGFLGVAVIVCTVIMCGMGAGLIIMAKSMLGVAICFGPVFIFSLLFKGTSDLFSRWIGTVINYGLVTVLVAAVFGLLMHFYSSAIAAAAVPNASSPILVSIMVCGLITVVSYFVMKEVPHMAASWGNGVSADIFKHLRRSTQPPSQKPAETPSSSSTSKTGGSASPSTSSASSNSASEQTTVSNSGTTDGSGMQGFAKGSRN